ncbi:MAG: glycosyltransferase family 4 protein [Bacteroidia bacterium]|nr:glycosyltransferase family 4 protein [Bacteroidia bacterium]
MPHIAVNTRLLLPNRLEGISRFAYEILRRMAAEHPEVTFTYFFDRAYDPAYLTSPNIRAEVLFPPARHPLLWHAWFHFQLRRRLSALQPDLFYSPEFYLSLHPRIPEIATFHDLAYEHFPQDLTGWAGRYVKKYSPQYAAHAREIVTVSEFTRQDLVEKYGIPAERIHVVYNSAGKQFFPIEREKKQGVREQFSQGKPYFHFVGTIQPRKNLENTLLAFDRFKKETGSEMMLLLVGRQGWNYQAALDTYEQLTHKADVQFTGYVSDEDLNRIYGASEGLVYVPWLEGFGIPIVEAFHAEIPVITSDCTSLPEVAGDAALLVAPADVAGMARAMALLATDAALSASLVEKGRLQRQHFSWGNSADTLWQLLSGYLR